MSFDSLSEFCRTFNMLKEKIIKIPKSKTSKFFLTYHILKLVVKDSLTPFDSNVTQCSVCTVQYVQYIPRS